MKFLFPFKNNIFLLGMGHAGTAKICVLSKPRPYWSYRTLITLKNAPTLLWGVRSGLGISKNLA